MEHHFQGAWAVSEFKKGREEGRAEGKLEERRNSVLELLEEMGKVPYQLYGRIMSEQNMDVLSKMRKLAAKSDSLEQFEEKISNL